MCLSTPTWKTYQKEGLKTWFCTQESHVIVAKRKTVVLSATGRKKKNSSTVCM